MAGGGLLVSAINISEGRRLDTVDKIAEAASRASQVLDIHSDPDHNRSVITLAGAPMDVASAVGAAGAACVQLIDLNRHEGVHPRLGALDVVPLVPFRGMGLEQAVSAAKGLATRLAEDLELPCFFYEMASEARMSLPEVRKRAFRTLSPDVGPKDPHPTAGAVSIGARGPLVAFNVELESRDLELAKEIARSLREAEGGLSGLRCLAFALASKGCVQVSMNLLEPFVTTPALALAEVERLARETGVRVGSIEIVGLAPEGALAGLDPGRLDTVQPSLEEALARTFGELGP